MAATMRETVLSILDGHDEAHRVVVALRHFVTGSTQMVLRHESWSEDVGWFAQSTIEMSAAQVSGLRATLGVQAAGLASASPACRGCVVDSRNRRSEWGADEREIISIAAHRAG